MNWALANPKLSNNPQMIKILLIPQR